MYMITPVIKVNEFPRGKDTEATVYLYYFIGKGLNSSLKMANLNNKKNKQEGVFQGDSSTRHVQFEFSHK